MPISQGLKDADRHAQSVRIHATQATSDSPDYRSASYLEQQEDVDLVRCVYGGTKAVRAKKEEYLPKHPKEEEQEYERRLKRAVLFNAFRRTVGGLVGMLFRKDPIVEDDVPPALLTHLDNVDQAGHVIEVFARESATDAMIDGHVWWHIDHPEVPATDNLQQERELGARPYWLRIQKSDAINVQWDIEAGVPFITLFVYIEGGTEPAGAFGEVDAPKIRVLRPGTWQIYELDDNDQWMLASEGTTSLDYVPVVFVPTAATGHFESEPPLLDLAYENVDHYQIRSDHRHAAMFASAPMPVFTGTDPTGVTWGPNRALFLPETEATAQILESNGTSLDSTRQDLKDSEARMAALGLQMLVRETRAAETAEAKLLDKSESESALSVVSRSLEDAIKRGLDIHADYLGIPDGGTIAINRDFHELGITSDQMAQLHAMVVAGNLSVDTMWAALVAGEVLPEDFDAEMEHEQIEGGMGDFEIGPTERRVVVERDESGAMTGARIGA